MIRGNQLLLERCPHCGVDTPNLMMIFQQETFDSAGSSQMFWRFFVCARCGQVVSVRSPARSTFISAIFPDARSVEEALPDRAKSYLQQAHDSLNAPAGAIMLACSSVDSMLKDRGITKGSLYHRIEEAVSVGLITEDMGKWAHEVRLDANDQRHSDSDAALPTRADAERIIDFASALGNILFTLPARVQRGIKAAQDNS